MCELMALSFARPVAMDFAFGPFGGRSVDNPHGWGVGWYPDQSLALFKEPVPWHSSRRTAFLQNDPTLSTRICIAHVRHKTTGGEPTHADTHPFTRELQGRDYCFAHNGTLQGACDLPLTGRFRPIGATDSEHIFCYVLEALERAGGVLNDPESWRWLHAQLNTANRMGQLNALLSDGHRLFCYHDASGYKGLHLCHASDREPKHGDADLRIDLKLGAGEKGYVIATRPFHERGWEKFQPGELLVFEQGKLCFSSHRAIEALD